MSQPSQFSPRGMVVWMANNPVAANLLMFVIIAGGLIGLSRTKQEVFPEFSLDIINITVPYPGASPEEVEQGILLALEEAVRGIDGVKRITAAASESGGGISVELQLSADPDKVLSDVKSEVDRITSFPEEAEEPSISIISNRNTVISLIIAADEKLNLIHEIAEKARAELIDHPDITQVEIQGIRPLEISIEISREVLEEYGLTLNQVAQQITAASIDLPVGGIETSTGDLLIRVTDRRYTAQEYKDIILRGTQQGLEVRLGEIAKVIDGYAESDQAYYYNGKRALRLTAYRVGDETPTRVAAVVREFAGELRTELPERFSVATWADRSEILEARVDLLVRNAVLGFFLVFIILTLFLKVRLAIWVALGIPICFLGVFAMMPTFDVSINMITLFAMIVTLGMVVDDAIIVGENIFSKMEDGMEPLEAASVGAKEMTVPVTFSILTTFAAFGALFFVPGFTGKFFRLIPTIVVGVLAISLIESFLILPAHLGHTKGHSDTFFGKLIQYVTRPLNAIQKIVSGGLEWFILHIYKPILHVALRLRYVTLLIAIGTFAGAFYLVYVGILPFRFFPSLEGDEISATARLPFGSPVEQTREVKEQLEKAAMQVIEENGGDTILRGVVTRMGEAVRRNAPSEIGAHLVSVEVNLVSIDSREISSNEFAKAWKKAMPPNPNIKTLLFDSTAGGPGAGSPIDIQLSHIDNETLRKASLEIERKLQSNDELTSIENGFSTGKPQLDFRLLPQASNLGLTSVDFARQLRNAFFGAEALREQRGRNELKVVVRLPKNQRQSPEDLSRLPIRTPAGGNVPLSYVATFSQSLSPTSIQREDGKRIVNISAELIAGVVSPRDAITWLEAEVLPEINARYPGLTAELVGEQREQAETFGNLGQNFIISLLVIFALLAVPFKSYTQPLIVMTAIPFGFVGAIIGHMLMGFELSIISMFGIVALSGVVVNDSLVLIDTTNTYRNANNKTAFESIVYGGMRRLRPILLTSLTTFFGLVPMILETSLQARFLIPMAISIGFGIIFATFIILLLVPSLYLILEDVLNLFRSKPKPKKETEKFLTED